MRTIGVFNFDPWTLLDDSSMKTELLYFDHLKYSFTGKEILERFCKELPKGKAQFEKRLKEIAELEKFGLISEYTKEQYKVDSRSFVTESIIDQNIKQYELSKGLSIKDKSWDNIFTDFLVRFREVGELESRKNSILLNKHNEEDFVPIIRGNYNGSDDSSLRKADVLSVVIKKFPNVTPTISTEKLFEFKNDEESSLKLHRLKNWAIDLTNSKLTTKEIDQKIEYLLIEYKKQLDLHKIKYETGIIETVVTIGLDVLENLVKLNLSKAAKVFFDIKKQELLLLEGEEKLVGKEVAYLHQVRNILE